MRYTKTYCLLALSLFSLFSLKAQDDYLLKADRVFDGFESHADWVVAVKGNKITIIKEKPTKQLRSKAKRFCQV
jgi:hypothetical protein